MIILVLLAIVIAGLLYFLSSQAREVPTQPVETEVSLPVDES